MQENILSYEAIKSQWDSELNEQPFPDDPENHKDIVGKWKCEKGHLWYETIQKRVHYQQCHMCNSPKRITEVYNLNYLRPDIAAQLHPTKNNGIKADKLTPSSTKKLWWLCPRRHAWEATVYNRTRGRNCIHCPKIRGGKDNTLAVLYPQYTKEWDYEKNGELTPKDVNPKSKIIVDWKCKKDHKWKQKLQARIILNSPCPECSHRKLGKDNNLATLYPHLAKQLHPTLNGTLTAYDLLPKSSKKVWWNCEKKHEWKTTVRSRTIKGRGCFKCYIENLKTKKH